MNKKLAVITLRNILLAGAYIFAVSQFMVYAEHLFDDTAMSNFFPFGMLLLFSLSAGVVGSLIFGQAAALFLENKRSEGIQAAVYSLGWLALITITVLTSLVLFK